MIIAIDGPAGSGKSTTARALAHELGFLYVDTGAMYRAFGLQFLRNGGDNSQGSIEALNQESEIELRTGLEGCRVFLNGEDVSDLIRTQAVSEAASVVAKVPAVRTSMVDRQRASAREAQQTVGGAILEGRDIGTVVFPDAELKVFLVADLEERARRRLQDLEGNGTTSEEVREKIRQRDQADRTRTVAPLRPAKDAVHIDTTHLTLEQQVDQIVGLARERNSLNQ